MAYVICKIIAFTVVFIQIIKCQNIDCYDSKFCRVGSNHVYCSKYPIEPNELLPKEVTTQFMDKINTVRNDVAVGRYSIKNSVTPQATNMRLMVWDVDLEVLAGLVAKRYAEVNTLCYSTHRYRNPISIQFSTSDSKLGNRLLLSLLNYYLKDPKEKQ